MLYFHTENDMFRNGSLVEVFLFVSAFLMASRLPTISLKHLRVPVRFVVFVLALAGFYAGLLVYKPWLALSLTFIGYLISVPICSCVFLKLKAGAAGKSEKAENK